MLLSDYIDSVYGTTRGNRARFLKDNPRIRPQELSRWLKAGLKIRSETGEIYKPVSRTVTVPETTAASAGVFLSMVRKMNHRFKNFLTMNSSVYNAVMMCHRERYGHKMLFSARF
ncbi:hypothetical protein ACWKX9_25070 [Enterobacter asburiae]